MNRIIPSGAGRVATKIAVAGVLFAAPVAAFGAPAFAATGFGGTPSVLPAPLPAEPQTAEPAPPAPPHQNYEYYNPEDPNDSEWYNLGADGGGGGGGVGG